MIPNIEARDNPRIGQSNDFWDCQLLDNSLKIRLKSFWRFWISFPLNRHQKCLVWYLMVVKRPENTKNENWLRTGKLSRIECFNSICLLDSMMFSRMSIFSRLFSITYVIASSRSMERWKNETQFSSPPKSKNLHRKRGEKAINC